MTTTCSPMGLGPIFAEHDWAPPSPASIEDADWRMQCRRCGVRAEVVLAWVDVATLHLPMSADSIAAIIHTLEADFANHQLHARTESDDVVVVGYQTMTPR